MVFVIESLLGRSRLAKEIFVSDWRHLRAVVFPLGLNVHHTFDIRVVSDSEIRNFFCLSLFNFLFLCNSNICREDG
jgi:hypothetical protein